MVRDPNVAQQSERFSTSTRGKTLKIDPIGRKAGLYFCFYTLLINSVDYNLLVELSVDSVAQPQLSQRTRLTRTQRKPGLVTTVGRHRSCWSKGIPSNGKRECIRVAPN